MRHSPKEQLGDLTTLSRKENRAAGKRYPPGPRGRHLLGSLLEVRKDRLSFVSHSLRDHGDLVGFRMGPKRLFLLSHPDHFRHVLCDNPSNYTKGVGLVEARPLLGEGLLTSEGELAASQRRRLQGAFCGPRLKEIAAGMAGAIDRLMRRWEQRAALEQPVDMAHEMVVLALGVLDATLLRGNLVPHAHEITEDLTVLTRWAMQRMTAFVNVPPWLPTPGNRQARRALKRLESLTKAMIHDRCNASGAHPDLLSLLLDPQQGLDERQVRDEILTFLLAGHETTAAALAWTWHLLAEHPEIQERMHAEASAALGGRIPEAQDLARLPFAKAVFEETIRLFPPVWMIPRRSVADDEVGGYWIPRRSDVLLCAYSLHRHPDFWPDPERFEPERFLGQSRPSAAFLPFGAGSRSCLGSRFASMEALMTLAAITQQYRLEAVPGATIEAEASLTLRPLHHLPLKVSRRP